MIPRGPALVAAAALAALLMPRVAMADDACGAGYHQTGEQDERQGDTIIEHPVCEADEAQQQQQQEAPAPKKPKAPCAAEQRQADLDLERVKKLRDQGEASQEDLREWAKMNADAQREAVLDAVKYFGGEYAENLAESKSALSKLEAQAQKLAAGANAYGSRAKARKQYAAALASLLNDMRPQMTDVLGRQMAKGASDANKLWEIGRDTMHARVAADATRNEELRRFLADPKFREAFAGEGDTESANAELFKTIGDTAVEQLSVSKKLLGRYAKITAPGVRAGEFVVDAFYDFWKSAASAEVTLQLSGAAGDFARATAALQKQHQRSVDALKKCRAGG